MSLAFYDRQLFMQRLTRLVSLQPIRFYMTEAVADNVAAAAAGPSKSELKKRAKEAEKEKRRLEREAKEAEQRIAKAAADVVSLGAVRSCGLKAFARDRTLRRKIMASSLYINLKPRQVCVHRSRSASVLKLRPQAGHMPTLPSCQPKTPTNPSCFELECTTRELKEPKWSSSSSGSKLPPFKLS
jgi:hypothetical protein